MSCCAAFTTETELLSFDRGARRHAERYIERPPTELVRQRARTAGYQCASKGELLSLIELNASIYLDGARGARGTLRYTLL
jgi:hypothetical protein